MTNIVLLSTQLVTNQFVLEHKNVPVNEFAFKQIPLVIRYEVWRESSIGYIDGTNKVFLQNMRTFVNRTTLTNK